MKIRSFIDLIGSRYNAQVSIEALTAYEEELINEFGCPVVEVGGTISGSATRPGAGAPTSVSIVLPTSQKRVPFDFPVKQVFDLADSVDSDVMAKVYVEAIVTRVTQAKSTLIAQASNFVGETTVTI